jgi:hypothetical protein
MRRIGTVLLEELACDVEPIHDLLAELICDNPREEARDGI